MLYGRETKIELKGVTPSSPYSAASYGGGLADVKPYVGNSTTAALGNEAWTGKYARLEIEGCWENDGKGATVGEFVLIGAGGNSGGGGSKREMVHAVRV